MWSSTAFDSFGMLKEHCSLAVLFLLYVAKNGFRLTWHAERSMLNSEDSLASQSVWILQRDNINFEFRYLTLNVIILTYVRARFIAFTLLDTMMLGHLPSCVQGSTFTNWLKVEDRLRRKLCRACFISLFLTCSPINASLTSQHGMSKIEASLIRAVFCIWRPLWTTN